MSIDTNLKINEFDGPLDLLLELVKDKQMDIFDIDLSELATQYLKLIDVLKDTNVDLASEYLVMAATLLQIKAKELLKGPEDTNEVDEVKEDLLKRLIEHQKYKNLSKILRENEIARKNIFIKDHSDYNEYQYEVDETKLDGKSDSIKLIVAMRKMFERIHAQKYRQATIETFNLSPGERRKQLLEILRNKQHVTFEDFFTVPTLNHFVVTMLTVLDMVRKQEIKLYQDEQFGTIKIERGNINV